MRSPLLVLGLAWRCATGAGFAAEGSAPSDELRPQSAPGPAPQVLSPADWDGIRSTLKAGRTAVSQQAYLKAHQVNGNDQFGFSVAVSGDTVVVGAVLEESGTTGVDSVPDERSGFSGAAYVFVRNGTKWTQQGYLKASQVNAGDNFGVSVAVSGDTVVVGAYNEDSGTTGINSTADESVTDSGAAYVFVRNGTNWTQQAYLKADRVNAFDGFGKSVAVSGDTLVVGAFKEDGGKRGGNGIVEGAVNDSGAAYVFVRNGTNWTQQACLTAQPAAAENLFGWSAAMSGDTVVIGAPGVDTKAPGKDGRADEVAANAGAAYVFTRREAAWTQQARLKAHEVSANDQFGYSVAVAGDTVVVGAQGEDGSLPGVNAAANENAEDSGAAYVYVRTATNWTQQAYLKGHQVTPGDLFGISVAVSGDVVVVGAHCEDSGTTGIDGVANESAADSGAAYVFMRTGTTWTQQAYLKAKRLGPFDRFGVSSAVDRGTVVVGAYGEDGLVAGVDQDQGTVRPDEPRGAGAVHVFTGLGPNPLAAAVTPPGTDWVPRGASRSWRALASSVDGHRIVAAAGGERLQVSTDAGTNWTAHATERDWIAVASSADGSRLVAAESGGPLFRSTDGGVSWFQCAPVRAWTGLASSADGLRLAAVAEGGPIQLSGDGGASWRPADRSRYWKGIASSADGGTLVAIVEDGPLLVSTDGGTTWVSRSDSKSWTAVAANSDGSVLVAAIWDGPVLVSADSGATWTARATNRFWHAVACSSDGRRMIAAETLGRPHVSFDSGLTWTERMENRDWASVAWSGDGEWVFAAPRDGALLVSTSRVTPHRRQVSSRAGPTSLQGLVSGTRLGLSDGQMQRLRWAVECTDADLFVSPPTLDRRGNLELVPAGRPGLTRVTLRARDDAGSVSFDPLVIEIELQAPDSL